jgi:hypothetical protein
MEPVQLDQRDARNEIRGNPGTTGLPGVPLRNQEGRRDYAPVCGALTKPLEADPQQHHPPLRKFPDSSSKIVDVPASL